MVFKAKAKENARKKWIEITSQNPAMSYEDKQNLWNEISESYEKQLKESLQAGKAWKKNFRKNNRGQKPYGQKITEKTISEENISSSVHTVSGGRFSPK